MPASPIHTRFAPTPSGLLHRGNALNAVLCWLWARHSGGSLRLRIDDLDRPRVRDAYLADVFEALQTLGLDWDHGPENLQAVAEYSQTRRLPRYRETLAALVKTGRVYACTCSRKQIRQALAERHGTSEGPLAYPGTCRERGLALDTPDSAWRLNLEGLPDEAWQDGWLGPVSYAPSREGDPVIRRRDGGLLAYHVASMTDDLDHGITGIVRGADLLSATVLQRAMARLLGWSALLELHWVHHPLLLDPQGEKWSKSAGVRVQNRATVPPGANVPSVKNTQEGAQPSGISPDDLVERLAVPAIIRQAADWLGVELLGASDARAAALAEKLLEATRAKPQLFPLRSATGS